MARVRRVRTGYRQASLLALLATSWSGVALAQHWGYSGEAGPENWSKIDAKYAMCGIGRNQSPIDLSTFVYAVCYEDDRSVAQQISVDDTTVTKKPVDFLKLFALLFFEIAMKL